MLRLIRFLTALAACIGAAFAASLLAVHAFWVGGKISHSVHFARAADTVGSLVLIPSRLALLVLDAAIGTSTLLPEPRLLAAINGVIIGLAFYAWLQRKRPASTGRSN